MPQHDDPTKPSTASHSASLTPSERAALIEHHPDEQTQLDVHPDEFGGSDDGSHYMSQTSAAKLRKGGATPTDEQPIQLDPFGGVYYDLRGRETIMCRDLGSHQTPHDAWGHILPLLRPLHAAGGQGLALVVNGSLSPTHRALQQRFVLAYPNAKVVLCDSSYPVNTIRAAEMAAGEGARIHYNLDRAKVIAAIDCDFLATEQDQAAQPKPATLTATELAATAAIAARSGVIINVVERGAPIMPGWYMSKAKPSWVFPGGEADWTPRKVVRADLAGSAELLVPASAEGEAPTTWHRLDLFEWGARTSPPGFGLARLEAITNRTPTAPNPTGRHVDDPPQLESERRAHEQAARRKAGLDPEFVSPIRGVEGSTPLTDAIGGERELTRLQRAVHVAISTWVLATLAFTSSAAVRAVDLILGVLLRGSAGRDLELVGVRDAASRIGDLVASPQHESAEVFKAICALLTGLDKAIVAELLGLPASAPPHLEPIHAPVQGLVSDAAARPLPGKGEAGEPAEMARERQHAELLAKSLPEIPRPLVDDLQSVRGKLDWSNDAQAREQAVVNAISDWLLDTDPRRHVLEVDRLLQNYLHQYVRWGDVEPANLTELAYQISSHFDGRSEAEVNASRNLQRSLVDLAESMLPALPQGCRACPHAIFTVHDDQGRAMRGDIVAAHPEWHCLGRTACKLLAGKQVSAGSMPLGRPSNCPLTALDTVRSEGKVLALVHEHKPGLLRCPGKLGVAWGYMRASGWTHADHVGELDDEELSEQDGSIIECEDGSRLPDGQWMRIIVNTPPQAHMRPFVGLWVRPIALLGGNPSVDQASSEVVQLLAEHMLDVLQAARADLVYTPETPCSTPSCTGSYTPNGELDTKLAEVYDALARMGVSEGLEVEHPERMCDDCRAARNLAPLANAHAPTRWNVPDDHVWVLEHVVRLRREQKHGRVNDGVPHDHNTLSKHLAKLVREVDNELLDGFTSALITRQGEPVYLEPTSARPVLSAIVFDTKPNSAAMWIGLHLREPQRAHGLWFTVGHDISYVDVQHARDVLRQLVNAERERRRPDRERVCAEPHPTKPGHYWARSPGWSEYANDRNWERTPWGIANDLVVEVVGEDSHGEPTDDLLWWCAEKGEWRPLDQLIWGPRVTTPSEQAMHETLWASICEALDIPPASTIDNVLARIDHLKPNF